MTKRYNKKYLIHVSVLTIGYFAAAGGAAAQTATQTIPCPGTESRAVTCRDFRGNAVADSFCNPVGGKPRGTRGCTTQCQIQIRNTVTEVEAEVDDGDPLIFVAEVEAEVDDGDPLIFVGDGGDGDGDGDGDPLIFDLDGNGITLLSPEDSNVMFDMDNDGVADRTGWVAAPDGILTLDENGNGKIDNQSEMFGNEVNLAYKHLAEYDSNNDGRIDREDRVWKHLSMWVDASVDGVTDPGELKTMREIGMEEIDLEYDTVDEIHAGNQVTGFGSFVRQVGHDGKRLVSSVMEALFSFFSG